MNGLTSPPRVFWLGCCFLVLMTLSSISAAASASELQWRQWIEEMKLAPRGPFSRLRWFCDDGTVLPPEPFACVPHGGGVQHGEWNAQAQQLRQNGFLIANLLAGGKGARLPLEVGQRAELIQTLLERFLIGHDDGWIYRGARSYRGGIQIEDEASAAQTLLYRLAQLPSLPNQDFLLLRQALQLLPGRQDSALAEEVRQVSTLLAERNRGFEPLRARIHGQPQFEDAARVRDFAATHPVSRDTATYERLAAAIEELFTDAGVERHLQALRPMLRSPSLRQELEDVAILFGYETSPEVRLLKAGTLLGRLRQGFADETNSEVRLQMLRTGLALEQELLRSGHTLLRDADAMPRVRIAGWISALNDALYGAGLVSARQWLGNGDALRRLQSGTLSIQEYRDNLRYLNRTPGWAANWFDYHFSEEIERLSRIEPKTANFIPDRLRVSPMLVFTTLLDTLSADANRLAGVQYTVFGETLGSGIRPLNAGIARGTLHLRPQPGAPLDPEGIYMLPETTASLTPVAGILTSGAGNSLSHVQLLAANLGIPNVVIDERVLQRLQRFDGQRVVLAVSPGGAVELALADTRWNAVFGASDKLPQGRLVPEVKKLQLTRKEFVSLAKLRANDSGRICGPKAANLGELKHHFPAAVTEGLVIPFGRFHEYLQQPMNSAGLSMLDWMRREYADLERFSGDARQAQQRRLLAQIRQWITSGEPGQAFRSELRQALQREFGADGSYAVFVRSDTNVEDLAGFTGAGLNLTLPNVRGVDNIIDAILQVWASPFSERAFAWRQQRMDKPEWVLSSVLLLKSVSVDKSGVMLTLDPETGDRAYLSIAVNHGIGGAVQGDSAEELRLARKTGVITVLADSAEPYQSKLGATGGLVKQALGADGDVLEVSEVQQLQALAYQAERKIPQRDEDGKSGAADIEFGFQAGRLVLFQIRPFVANKQAQKLGYLRQLDARAKLGEKRVDMTARPVR